MIWLEIVQSAVEAPSTEAFWREVVEALARDLRCESVAIVTYSGAAWRTVASSPRNSKAPPYEVAASALDSDKPISERHWTAAPLGHDTALLVLRGREVPADLLAGLAAASKSLAMRLKAMSAAARLGRLLEATRAWGSARGTKPLLEAIAATACELFDSDRASIFLWDEPNGLLVGRPALGIEGGELRISDDKGVVGAVLSSGNPMRIGAADASAIERSVDQRTGYKTNTLLCVPLDAAGGKRLGVFELINKRSGEFTEEDQAGLITFAGNAAMALDSSQQFDELLDRHGRLVDQAASRATLIGDCPAIDAIRSTLRRVADTDLAILVLGENGSGKEVIAQSLHYQSRRRSGPFVAVNCAAIAESLLESELFGHERGAFTDAHTARPGKFEIASGGTLFLDEIGDMSLAGQAKLLRVLEEKVVVRVGGSAPLATDVRIVAATNQDLGELVRAKKFREDLFYRLNVVSIEAPPLRSRGEDVLLLAEHFLNHFALKMGRRTPKLSAEARKRLLAHSWPGNVRELRNLMERTTYLSAGTKIEASDLAFVAAPGRPDSGMVGLDLPLTAATHEFQRSYIRHAIEACGGSVTDAADRLGVHRSNLYRKMGQLGMAGEGGE